MMTLVTFLLVLVPLCAYALSCNSNTNIAICSAGFFCRKRYYSISRSRSNEGGRGSAITTVRERNNGLFDYNHHTVSSSSSSSSSELIRKSYISKIMTHGLAGATTTTTLQKDEASTTTSDGTISFSLNPNFVAVTGETGSGKSLLLRTAANLLLGGKATLSLVVPPTPKSDDNTMIPNNSTSVGIEAHLGQPHLDHVNKLLQTMGLRQCPIIGEVQHKDDSKDHSNKYFGMLHLERNFYLATGGGSSSSSSRTSHSNNKRVLRSKCYVNGQVIGIKALKLLTSTILTTVDAAAASSALNRPTSRLSVVDFGVSDTIKRKFIEAKRHYQSTKQKRQLLQEELTQRQRALPSYDDGMHTSLMNSWIQEFTDFQQQMDKLRIRASMVPNRISNEKTTALHLAFLKLAKSKWCDYVASTSTSSSSSGRSKPIKSSFAAEEEDFYSCLLTVLSELKVLESQLIKSRQAYDTLMSLSSPNSAISASERVRRMLMDITSTIDSEEEEDPLFVAVERTHDLLNAVDSAIRKCAQSIDNNDDTHSGSIISKLEFIKRTAPISLDEMEQHVASWNSLARKHGVSPYKLLSCQSALVEEYEGDREAKLKLLPAALAEEENAKDTYQMCYKALHEARLTLSKKLSDEVTELLPHLGMNGCQFTVQLRNDTRDPVVSYIDKLDFVLSYGGNSKARSSNHLAAGKISSTSDFIASSGEKARILLALETVLPGSIGACCTTGQTDASPDFEEMSTVQNDNESLLQNHVAPIAVMYDEVDAHVGGQAVVAVAKMLFQQSRSGGQVISITHSASVAAFADQHLVIHRKHLKDSNRMAITIIDVSGEARGKELARMTSGDMATEEARRFADALLREREEYISIGRKVSETY